MEQSIIERIKFIIEEVGETPRNFAGNIKFNYSTLNNYLTGRRTTIDSELIRKIILSYGNISAEWLLTGKGPVLRSDFLKQSIQAQPTINNQSFIAEIDELKNKIARLEGQNDLLREQLGLPERKSTKIA